MRAFDLIVGGSIPTYAWFGTGQAYAFVMGIAVSYAGLELELFEDMRTADDVDLTRALNQLRDPTLPGLCDVRPIGFNNESVDSEGNIYLEHQFQVHYHQDTNALV